MNISALRQEYLHARLDENAVAHDPIMQFETWLAEAMRAELPMANAMALATVSESGRPTLRMVLLKHVDARGFGFYTNYQSRKGTELAAHAEASLLFHWTELERQVRIEGRVEKTSTQEADEYFLQRPLGSRHAAIASPQSRVVPDRAELEKRFSDVARQYGEHPPRPSHWGGYRLIPDTLEFWQGRENRLHDRLQYRLTANNQWIIERLAP
jgi:pyridoxamine 5'-phosphate oxidase